MIKIGLCGLGTVGRSFVEHIDESYNLIKNKLRTDFGIVAIADRSIKNKKYKSGIQISENPIDLANDKDLDVIVELRIFIRSKILTRVLDPIDDRIKLASITSEIISNKVKYKHKINRNL